MEEYVKIHQEAFDAWKARQDPLVFETLGTSQWGWDKVYKPLEKHDIHGKYFTLNPDVGLIHIKPEPPKPATINAWLDNPHNESLSQVIGRILLSSRKREEELLSQKKIETNKIENKIETINTEYPSRRRLNNLQDVPDL